MQSMACCRKVATFIDILDIIDPVLGEFLDSKSLGLYLQTAKICLVNTRVWRAAYLLLKERWRTLGSISFRDEQWCRRLTTPWRLNDYSWKEVELNEEIWAGQAPQVFWIGGSRVVCIAGAIYPDQIGGATPLPLNDVTILCTATGEVERLDVEGPSHPQIMGCAATYDHETDEVICFGGGNPVDPRSLTDVTSLLNIRTKKWSRLTYAAGEIPCARQGLHATIYEGRFYIFGGRKRGGDCVTDVWALDCETKQWHEIATSGTAPTPRVWYAACHAPYGQWCIIGGSLWNFTMPEDVDVYRDLYIFHFASHTWERVETPTSPEWCTAPCLVPLGSRQLVYFGGCKVHLVNTNDLHVRDPNVWQNWYPSFQQNIYVFDRETKTWEELNPSARRDEEDDHTYFDEMLRRSHFASCAVVNEHGNSVVIIGGSRYFTGEYFHDLFVFHQAPPERLEYNHRRYMMAHTRGQLGRLRALVRHGYLLEDQYEEILERLAVAWRD